MFQVFKAVGCGLWTTMTTPTTEGMRTLHCIRTGFTAHKLRGRTHVWISIYICCEHGHELYCYELNDRQIHNTSDLKIHEDVKDRSGSLQEVNNM